MSDTTTTRKSTRKAAAPKADAAATTTTEAPKVLKLRMTLAITLPDPAAWELDDVTEIDPAKLVEALKAQGVPAEIAEATAAKTAATVSKTGVGELRDAVKQYVLAGVLALDKVKNAEALVSIAAAHA